MVAHGVYGSAGEDEWIAIACRDDDEWRALCSVIPELDPDADFAARPHDRTEIDEAISRWTARRENWVAAGELQIAGVPAVPVNTTPDMLDDPQTRERGFLCPSNLDRRRCRAIPSICAAYRARTGHRVRSSAQTMRPCSRVGSTIRMTRSRNSNARASSWIGRRNSNWPVVPDRLRGHGEKEQPCCLVRSPARAYNARRSRPGSLAQLVE